MCQQCIEDFSANTPLSLNHSLQQGGVVKNHHIDQQLQIQHAGVNVQRIIETNDALVVKEEPVLVFCVMTSDWRVSEMA
jgi:hypothetical protein